MPRKVLLDNKGLHWGSDTQPPTDESLRLPNAGRVLDRVPGPRGCWLVQSRAYGARLVRAGSALTGGLQASQGGIPGDAEVNRFHIPASANRMVDLEVRAAGRYGGEMQPSAYPLQLIYFYLTKGCNLACRHCWIAPKFQSATQVHPALPFDTFRSIVEQAKPLGLSGVKLTGGEPLLYPLIGDILDLVRKHGLRLIVETNGVLLTPQLARQIACCQDPLVSISLDGASRETHEWVRGIPGCFDQAIRGVAQLVAMGLRPQIIMSLLRRNKTEIEPLVRLAEELGAASVKFNVVQPVARGEMLHGVGEALTIEELVELGRWVESGLSASTPLSLFYSHPLAFRTLSSLFGSERNGCSVCGILGILGVLADGSYALCGIGETVPQLVFGHSADVSLEDVWQNSPVLRDLRAGLPHRLGGACAQCLMKPICLGSCIAQNFYRSQSLWAGFWYCEQAQQRGVFPRQRLARVRGEPATAQGDPRSVEVDLSVKMGGDR